METKECQYCTSAISKKAKKCKYCHEWQDDLYLNTNKIEDIEDVINFKTQFPNAKKPFQLILVEKLPFHYAVSILIVGVIIFVFIQLSWYNYQEDGIYLLTFLFYSLQLVITWAGLIWIYNIIGENYNYFIKISNLGQTNVEQTFIKDHGMMFKNRYSILSGVFIGLVASIGDFLVGTPFRTIEAKLIFAGFEFINMFFAGAAIYTMLMFAFFIHKISSVSGSQELKVNNNTKVVNNIGIIHLKTSIIVIVPLVLGVIARLFGNWNWELLIIIWYFSFAIGLIIYLYWPMNNIHKLMKVDIESQATIIYDKIQKVLIDITHNPSSRNFIKLSELRGIEKSILDQNTWPFETKNLTAAFFAIIFPIVLIIIDKFWQS